MIVPAKVNDMKRIFSTDNTSSANASLLVLRIGLAALMLTHGLPKLMMLLGSGPIQFPPALGLSSEATLLLAVCAEVLCTVFVLAGLATRLAVIPLMITMLVAALIIHGSDPFTKQEPALLYLLICTTLLIGGSGKYSLDYVLLNRAGH